MNWKKFFKPTASKLILFIIAILLTTIFPNILMYGSDLGKNYGFPFNFYGYGGGPALKVGESIPFYFHSLTLILDILIWYLIACIILIKSSLKNKK